MLAYFNQSPYAKVHGLEGEEALIAQTKKPQRTPGTPAFFRQHSQKNILREPYV